MAVLRAPGDSRALVSRSEDFRQVDAHMAETRPPHPMRDGAQPPPTFMDGNFRRSLPVKTWPGFNADHRQPKDHTVPKMEPRVVSRRPPRRLPLTEVPRYVYNYPSPPLQNPAFTTPHGSTKRPLDARWSPSNSMSRRVATYNESRCVQPPQHHVTAFARM